jgi:hypothetical protein
MALRAVPDHPKFANLKSMLGLPKGAALGWLEALWHFTGRFTPQGNIGKYTDQAIEAWVEWDGTPGKLVAALIETGWLDVDCDHRILVHDWREHADKATKNAISRANLTFCTPGVRTEGVRCTYTNPESGTVYRLPEPEPVPVPDPEPVQKPSRAKKARAAKDGPTKTDLANGRHAEFKGLIEKYWNSVNLDIAMPWDGQEGRNLEIWLRGNPGVTAQQFRRFLYNRSKSDVNQGDRPGLWVRSMTSYARGPIDRFKNTATGNGVPIPAAHPSQEKQNADDERAREMWESMSDVYREAHPWKA